ncbi:unnamed protein product [Didymodactylos carnosus]|uniref:Uncharacterized protein n=1 Tax=Didymodactylos carnosus TaxID=1234261 RepID=A0A813T6B2_9BILA|nr:unnamed protein product [Didymodactylos carnosus]CAF0804884.1 unnamed protein product [Didymodactylos carnosus]CAF3499085.1 unnamed protein product [Didymodactylos carnosus]CAF3590060.1 unnamed protein product [Didymodactylos carnosus]
MPSSELFVGNLNRDVSKRDLEDIFESYGRLIRCELKQGASSFASSYGFLEFESSNDADAAIKGENGRDHQGKAIIVEWARSSRRGPPTGSNNFRRGGGGGGGGGGRDLTCFNCGRSGHISRNCRSPRQGDRGYNGGGGDRDRGDRGDRGDRDRGGDRNGGSNRSSPRGGYERRRRSNSGSPEKRDRRSRSRSRSRSGSR